MISRTAVTLALIVIVAALWLLQSTSPAKSWPMLGWPNPQRYMADIQASGTAGPQVAVNLTRVTPLSADTMAILALSAAQGKDEQRAASALTIAGRMGWHQPVVQSFWLQAALAAQDWKIAAERLDALLRTGAPVALWHDAMATLLARPEGLKAMAVQAASNPDWTSQTLVSVDADQASQQMLVDRLALVELAWRQGLRIDCTSLARLTNATVEFGPAARGNDLWTRHCDPRSIAQDGVFNLSTLDSVAQTRSLFAWTAISSGRFSTNLTPDAQHGAVIDINSSSMTSETVAHRLLTLAPGRYRLSWKADHADSAAPHGVSFSVRCKTPGSPQSKPVPAETNSAHDILTFTIAQQDCPIQDISIIIASSNRPFSSMAATVTDIRLQHVI